MAARLGLVCVVFLSLFLLGMCVASAKWKPEFGQSSPEIQKWFSEQHNSAGEWCCNEADGHRFDGEYSFDKDGNVTVIENGKTYQIEKYKVLMGHNPTGEAVWWFIDSDGGRRTYCFSPGSLT